jgi:uncharacterized membrane protein
MTTKNKHKKLIYILLLFLLGVETYHLFSVTEMNIFVKIYGLTLVLQAGFAIVYLSFQQRKKVSRYQVKL